LSQSLLNRGLFPTQEEEKLIGDIVAKSQSLLNRGLFPTAMTCNLLNISRLQSPLAGFAFTPHIIDEIFLKYFIFVTDANIILTSYLKESNEVPGSANTNPLMYV